jgi:hypothetical protein
MLISHSRPIHELISPNLLDQKTVFEHQFAGMTLTAFRGHLRIGILKPSKRFFIVINSFI